MLKRKYRKTNIEKGNNNVLYSTNKRMRRGEFSIYMGCDLSEYRILI